MTAVEDLRELRQRIEDLALEWEQDAQGYAIYGPEGKAREARERAQRLRAALNAPPGVSAEEPDVCPATHEADGGTYHCLAIRPHGRHIDSRGRTW